MIIACSFALCSSPAQCHVDWAAVPLYSSEKESDAVPLFNKAPLADVLSTLSPPAADVQQYCAALLLPLLRSSPSIGSELVSNQIENHIVKAELLRPSLLPSVILALAGSLKLTAVDVAHIVASYILPLAADTPSKLHVRQSLQPLFPFELIPHSRR